MLSPKSFERSETHIRFARRSLRKRYPLAISRGTSVGSENLFVFASRGAYTGVGECAPGAGHDDTLASLAERCLADFCDSETATLSTFARDSIDSVYESARHANIPSPAVAALDIALWDLLGKEAQMPLYRLLGFGRPSVPTSVTIGLNDPEVTRERVPKILAATRGQHLKIKLGSRDGIDFDKAHFAAAEEAARPFSARLRVDANGGWSLADARRMLTWLARRNVDYVEQPLPEGHESELAELYRGRPLPLFVDESCRTADDVPSLADRCDGVNLKLMKCGGITGALRIIATARACRLKLMIGCMGETSIAIAAGVAVSAPMDHIDLDAHLNLDPDPAAGLTLERSVVTPQEAPGHGARLKDEPDAQTAP